MPINITFSFRGFKHNNEVEETRRDLFAFPSGRGLTHSSWSARLRPREEHDEGWLSRGDANVAQNQTAAKSRANSSVCREFGSLYIYVYGRVYAGWQGWMCHFDTIQMRNEAGGLGRRYPISGGCSKSQNKWCATTMMWVRGRSRPSAPPYWRFANNCETKCPTTNLLVILLHTSRR